jgi:hypothetical protein
MTILIYYKKGLTPQYSARIHTVYEHSVAKDLRKILVL